MKYSLTLLNWIILQYIFIIYLVAARTESEHLDDV